MQVIKFMGALLAIGLWAMVTPSNAADRRELNADANRALATLLNSVPEAKIVADKANGVLIFPRIVKAGFMIGGATGEGVLRVNGKTDSYYRSVAVSYGLQAGATWFGYLMFLMDDDAVDYLRRTDGWEIGVGPNVTIADQGLIARRFSTTTLEKGIIVFFVDQEGLFGGIGLEGTKIHRQTN